MVSRMDVECDCPPPEPSIVSGYVPELALLETEIVKVDEYVGVPLVGFRDAVTPDGWPETVSETGSAVPLFKLTVTVADWVCPGCNVSELGDSIMSKSNGVGAAIENV
jgi:hypothetical protein